MIYEITTPKIAAPLFDNWQETIIWSCLQGIMGNIYADVPDNPTSAMAILGDFTFFAGKPSIELATYKPAWCTQDFMIMIPQNAHWKNTIMQTYGDKAKVVSRYATKKEPDIFDREKLNKIVSSLPGEYQIHRIDEPLYQMCKAQSWSADLVSQFPNYDMYHKLGLGFVVLKDDTIVSGASSYTRYLEGIEIEIDTKKEYRRRGLAYACGAKLILECLKCSLYPSWDAQNKCSIALAEKLGYHYSHTYTAIEVQR